MLAHDGTLSTQRCTRERRRYALRACLAAEVSLDLVRGGHFHRAVTSVVNMLPTALTSVAKPPNSTNITRPISCNVRKAQHCCTKHTTWVLIVNAGTLHRPVRAHLGAKLFPVLATVLPGRIRFEGQQTFTPVWRSGPWEFGHTGGGRVEPRLRFLLQSSRCAPGHPIHLGPCRGCAAPDWADTSCHFRFLNTSLYP